MTTLVVRRTVTGVDDLEQKYVALVERISRYPMSEAASAVIRAEIEATYRREMAAEQEGSELRAAAHH